MQKLLKLCMTVVMMFLVVPVGSATDLPEYVSGEVLVKTRSMLKSVDVQQLLPKAKKAQRLTRQVTKYTLPSDVSVQQTVDQLKLNPAVEYVQPNYIKRLQQVPNDPSFEQQWALQNTGQSVPSSGGVAGTSGADIKVAGSWDITQGSRQVVIAILDSGLDLTHPDLIDNLWLNGAESSVENGIDDDGNGKVDDLNGWDFVHEDSQPLDLNGHGTRVAGIIAAKGNNGSHVSGVMWRASLMPLQVFDANGFGTTEHIVAAIDYAIAHDVDLINASFGAPGVANPNFNGSDQLEYEAFRRARDANIPVIAAACNTNSGGTDNDTSSDGLPCVPASYDLANIIAVAATDQEDRLAPFSHYGAETVDLAAPGTNIVSTSPEFVNIVPEFAMTSIAGAAAEETVDLQGRQGCRLVIDRQQISEPIDGLQVRLSDDGVTWLSVSGDDTLGPSLLYDLSALDGRANAMFSLTPLLGMQAINTDVQFNRVVAQCYSGSHDQSMVTLGDGTSLASAYVTGVAGLVFAHFGRLDYNRLSERLMQTVDENPAELTGVIKSGGRVNAARALGGTVSAPNVAESNGGGGGLDRFCILMLLLIVGHRVWFRPMLMNKYACRIINATQVPQELSSLSVI